MFWMQENDWKNIFYNIKYQNLMKKKGFTDVSDDPCKPFLDITASVERGVVELTKYIIEVEGFDVNKKIVVDTSHFEMDIQPLNIALKLPDLEMLRYLIKVKNVDVNCSFQKTFGNTILHYAAGDNQVSPDHLAILLSHPHILIDVRDVIGKTALHYVCWFLPNQCEEKLRLLIKAGADVNAIGDDGNDPMKILLMASKHRGKDIERMQILLRKAAVVEGIPEPSSEMKLTN